MESLVLKYYWGYQRSLRSEGNQEIELHRTEESEEIGRVVVVAAHLMDTKKQIGVQIRAQIRALRRLNGDKKRRSPIGLLTKEGGVGEDGVDRVRFGCPDQLCLRLEKTLCSSYRRRRRSGEALERRDAQRQYGLRNF
ncbi:hypothetical protein U1Q18_046944 [Sarracenia purpurea var. burkii]